MARRRSSRSFGRIDRMPRHADGRAGHRPSRSNARAGRRRCTCTGPTPFRQAAPGATGRDGIKQRPCRLVLPRDDLLEPLGLDEPDRARELAHPEVEACDLVFRLPVVCESRARTRRARAGSKPASHLPPSRSFSSRANDQMLRRPRCPAGGPAKRAMRVRTVLDQEDPSSRQYAAMCSISNARWPPIWHKERRSPACVARPSPRSLQNETQRSSRLQSTNSTRAPAKITDSGSP